MMPGLMVAAPFRIETIMERGSMRLKITPRALATPTRPAGLDVEMTPCMALEDLWI